MEQTCPTGFVPQEITLSNGETVCICINSNGTSGCPPGTIPTTLPNGECVCLPIEETCENGSTPLIYILPNGSTITACPCNDGNYPVLTEINGTWQLVCGIEPPPPPPEDCLAPSQWYWMQASDCSWSWQCLTTPCSNAIQMVLSDMVVWACPYNALPSPADAPICWDNSPAMLVLNGCVWEWNCPPPFTCPDGSDPIWVPATNGQGGFFICPTPPPPPSECADNEVLLYTQQPDCSWQVSCVGTPIICPNLVIDSNGSYWCYLQPLPPSPPTCPEGHVLVLVTLSDCSQEWQCVEVNSPCDANPLFDYTLNGGVLTINALSLNGVAATSFHINFVHESGYTVPWQYPVYLDPNNPTGTAISLPIQIPLGIEGSWTATISSMVFTGLDVCNILPLTIEIVGVTAIRCCEHISAQGSFLPNPRMFQLLVEKGQMVDGKQKIYVELFTIVEPDSLSIFKQNGTNFDLSQAQLILQLPYVGYRNARESCDKDENFVEGYFHNASQPGSVATPFIYEGLSVTDFGYTGITGHLGNRTALFPNGYPPTAINFATQDALATPRPAGFEANYNNFQNNLGAARAYCELTSADFDANDECRLIVAVYPNPCQYTTLWGIFASCEVNPDCTTCNGTTLPPDECIPSECDNVTIEACCATVYQASFWETINDHNGNQPILGAGEALQGFDWWGFVINGQIFNLYPNNGASNPLSDQTIQQFVDNANLALSAAGFGNDIVVNWFNNATNKDNIITFTTCLTAIRQIQIMSGNPIVQLVPVAQLYKLTAQVPTTLTMNSIEWSLQGSTLIYGNASADTTIYVSGDGTANVSVDTFECGARTDSIVLSDAICPVIVPAHSDLSISNLQFTGCTTPSGGGNALIHGAFTMTNLGVEVLPSGSQIIINLGLDGGGILPQNIQVNIPHTTIGWLIQLDEAVEVSQQVLFNFDMEWAFGCNTGANISVSISSGQATDSNLGNNTATANYVPGAIATTTDIKAESGSIIKNSTDTATYGFYIKNLHTDALPSGTAIPYSLVLSNYVVGAQLWQVNYGTGINASVSVAPSMVSGSLLSNGSLVLNSDLATYSPSLDNKLFVSFEFSKNKLCTADFTGSVTINLFLPNGYSDSNFSNNFATVSC